MRALPVRPLVVVVIVLLIGSTAIACGRAVSVQVPDTAQDEERCRALKDALPDELAGERRLTVQPDAPFTAAWGAPAIVWRCDVPTPAALAADSQLIVVNGRDWYPEMLERGVRFSTVSAEPSQELTVPSDYPDPAGLLTLLP